MHYNIYYLTTYLTCRVVGTIVVGMCEEVVSGYSMGSLTCRMVSW